MSETQPSEESPTTLISMTAGEFSLKSTSLDEMKQPCGSLVPTCWSRVDCLPLWDCSQTGCGRLVHPSSLLGDQTEMLVGPRSPSWGIGIDSYVMQGNLCGNHWAFWEGCPDQQEACSLGGETRLQCLRNWIEGIVKCCGWKEPERLLVVQDKGCSYQVILN